MIEVLRLLHEMGQDATRYSSSYYCRSLDKHEPIPQFGHGIPDSPLSQRDWIWIAYSSTTDEPLAILVAAPMQQVAILVRAYGIPSAPNSVFLGLLRKCLADILSRGYTRYVTMLSLERKEEAKLARLVIKAGGIRVSDCTLFTGPADISKW